MRSLNETVLTSRWHLEVNEKRVDPQSFLTSLARVRVGKPPRIRASSASWTS